MSDLIERTNKRTETHACDCISRRAAIDVNDVRKIVEKYLDADDCNGSDVAMDILSDIRELPPAQPETDKRDTESAQNIPNDDPISKKMAIEAINTWDKFGVDERGRLVRWHEGLEPYVHLRDVLTAIVNLPPAQPELTADAEFWRKRADYYYDMCSKLIADMGAGVKIEAVKIDETGITFTKKKPPEQQIDLQEIEDRFGEYVRFVVNDMLTGEGKRWTR